MRIARACGTGYRDQGRCKHDSDAKNANCKANGRRAIAAARQDRANDFARRGPVFRNGPARVTRLAAILAGGQSRRFGSDKALAVWEGQPLIVHAAAVLARHSDEVIVCGRSHSPLTLTHLRDRPAPGLGPLGGLCAALHYAAEAGHDAVLSLGCDMPRLDARLLDRLCRPGPGRYLVEAPIIGCWPAALAGPLADYLLEGRDRAVWRWAAQAGMEGIEAGVPLANLNTPADLSALR